MVAVLLTGTRPARARHRRLLLRAGLGGGLALLMVLAVALGPVAGNSPAAAETALSGYDVSWPQCPTSVGGYDLPMPPDSAQFVIVGLTKGLGFTENPCLASQVGWARTRGTLAHAYTMATFPTATQLSAYGSAGPWASSTRAARLSNVGYAEAQAALASMRKVGWSPPVVWIDVEPRPAQPWPVSTAQARIENRHVIEGLIRGLADAGVGYGLYSYTSGWDEITGSWRLPGVPVWATAGRLDYPNEALDRCTQPSFSGGRVYVSQWTDGTRDYNLTCGAYALTSLPTNLARAERPTVTASSESAATGQSAAKAVDSSTVGYPGDPAMEWATAGGKAGSWVQLTWARPVTLDRAVLYDRPNTGDQVTGGSLTFSDGSNVGVGALDNAGTATEVPFAARTVTSVRFTVSAVSTTTYNVGLAEIEAWGSVPLVNVARTAGVSVTASSENAATGQAAAKAVDGSPLGYPTDATKEWATVGGKAGSWIQLTWPTPVTLNRVVLYDRPNTGDQVTAGSLTFSDGSTVPTGSLTNAGAATDLTFAPRTVTTVRLTISSVSAATFNVGLAEIEAWGTGRAVNRAPVASAGRDQVVAVSPGATVTLDGTASSDPDGDALTYAWTQTAGPSVTLGGATTANATFAAPATATALAFSLVVSDGLASSPADTVAVSLTEPGITNLARTAISTVTASSENTATGQTAVRAVDGSATGYPTDYTKEWATVGGKAGSWIQLTWPTPVTLSRVVLHDRPNTADQVTSGTLTFSDGSTLAVGALDNTGAATEVTFPARTVTNVRFTVSTVSPTTYNTGLAELETWGTATP